MLVLEVQQTHEQKLLLKEFLDLLQTLHEVWKINN